ncbi:class I SAM-dependent methyltransferase [Jeongeupia chitinilytica]|uniref:Class I SAM-dependent methyltransferase n=1 Tax=Jeongeupia chitinilytica TaxID=1041641 RepID=A0ABQ3GZP9_9NEIS|nr:class I SAM-dependent methyltransferase [Jeongeupia chitinilytica]GHD60211.1 hypothetical protein GCM10007350_12840 [Jeongeupia chitinilytica]
MTVIFRIVLLQCVALGVTLLAQWWMPVSAPVLMGFASLAGGGLAALHFRRWWMALLNAVMPPVGLLALSGNIPSWFWLVAAILTWAIGAGAFRSRVPLYLSNRGALRQLEPLIPQGAHVIDLGAGTGTVLAWLARRRPDLRLTGVELAWLPWCAGWLRLRKRGVNWHRADAFAIDLAAYDVVYAYLSPAPMAALWNKARAEMASSAILISNSFEIDGVPPHARHPVGDWKQSELLVWHPNSQTRPVAGA